MSDGLEALNAAMHGDGSGGPGIAGAAPCAEPSDDPGGPRQGLRFEGVTKAGCAAVDVGCDDLEDSDIVVLEGSQGRPLIGAIAGMDERHGEDGGPQCD